MHSHQQTLLFYGHCDGLYGEATNQKLFSYLRSKRLYADYLGCLRFIVPNIVFDGNKSYLVTYG